MLLLISAIIMLATRDCDVSKLADGDFLRGFAIRKSLNYSYHCPPKKHFNRVAIMATVLCQKRAVFMETVNGGLWICF